LRSTEEMQKAIKHLRGSDPVLAGIIERVGPCRIAYSEPGFSTVVRSIISQQLSSKAAATIHGRLREHLKGEVTAEKILRLRADKLRSFGISAQKQAYLKDLASRTVKRELDFPAFDRMSDQEVIEALTLVKGVGVWTAHMFLIFALRRPDILPVGDLGIRNAIHKAYELEAPPPPKRIEEIGLPWRPYASVAAWYLWRSLQNGVAAL
jgi:DNA-3-methyladenine glycosylase II